MKLPNNTPTDLNTSWFGLTYPYSHVLPPPPPTPHWPSSASVGPFPFPVPNQVSSRSGGTSEAKLALFSFYGETIYYDCIPALHIAESRFKNKFYSGYVIYSSNSRMRPRVALYASERQIIYIYIYIYISAAPPAAG